MLRGGVLYSQSLAPPGPDPSKTLCGDAAWKFSRYSHNAQGQNPANEQSHPSDSVESVCISWEHGIRSMVRFRFSSAGFVLSRRIVFWVSAHFWEFPTPEFCLMLWIAYKALVTQRKPNYPKVSEIRVFLSLKMWITVSQFLLTWAWRAVYNSFETEHCKTWKRLPGS